MRCYKYYYVIPFYIIHLSPSTLPGYALTILTQTDMVLSSFDYLQYCLQLSIAHSSCSCDSVLFCLLLDKCHCIGWVFVFVYLLLSSFSFRHLVLIRWWLDRTIIQSERLQMRQFVYKPTQCYKCVLNALAG